MLQVDDKEKIRRAFFLDNKSQRQIAQEFHHSRRTIAAALVNAKPSTYELYAPRASPVLARYKPIIDQWLSEDRTAPRKQRRTAHRMYTQLCEEHDFTGAESSVRCYVRQRRLELEPPEAFLLLEYAPGQDA